MRIFLSHKAERDQDRAGRVKAAIEGLDDSLEVFVSSADIAAAENWPNRIREELRTTDLLLLLYTDPNHDWGWCMYEAGLYANMDGDPKDDDPITYLYHQRATPPSQLRDSQGVKATEEGIARFLADLTTAASKRKSPTAAQQTKVEKAAQAIAQEFPDRDSYYVSYTVVLDVRGHDPGQGLPLDAAVTATGSTISVLGKAGADRLTWAELTEQYREGPGQSTRWLDELDSAFIEASRRRPCRMIGQTFVSHEGGLILHPVLHRVDRVGGVPVQVEIAFVAEDAPSTVGGPVFAMVRTLERRSTELVDAFLEITGGVAILTEDADVEVIGTRLELVKRETDQQRVFTADKLRLFGDNEDSVKALCKNWETLTAALGRSCKAKKPNVVTMAEHLKKMGIVNNDLTKIVAARYAELVRARSEVGRSDQ